MNFFNSFCLPVNGFGGFSFSSFFHLVIVVSTMGGLMLVLLASPAILRLGFFGLSGSGFHISNLSKSHSTGSEKSCAVFQLSCVLVVSGVGCSCSGLGSGLIIGSVAGALHNCSILNGSNGCIVGSPPKKLLLRGPVSGLSSDDSLGGLKGQNLRKDVLFLVYLLRKRGE